MRRLSGRLRLSTSDTRPLGPMKGSRSRGDVDCVSFGRDARVDVNLDFLDSLLAASEGGTLEPEARAADGSTGGGCAIRPRRTAGASALPALVALALVQASRLRGRGRRVRD